MRYVAVFVLFLGALGIAHGATVYKSVGPDGEVEFSDEPKKGAEEIHVPDPQTYTPRRVRPSTSRSTPTSRAEKLKSLYTEFRIVTPSNDATFRGAKGEVRVTVAVVPRLRSGDGIAYLLDGNQVGEATPSLSRVLTDVDRGTHSISARIVDVKGKTLARAGAVTVHVHRPDAAEAEGGEGDGDGDDGNGPGGGAKGAGGATGAAGAGGAGGAGSAHGSTGAQGAKGATGAH